MFLLKKDIMRADDTTKSNGHAMHTAQASCAGGGSGQWRCLWAGTVAEFCSPRYFATMLAPSENLAR